MLWAILPVLICSLTSSADCRGLVSGGGGGGGAPTATVTAIVTTPSPCAGGATDTAGTLWCNISVVTSGGVVLNNPVFSYTTSAPAGFNGVLNSGGSITAGSSTTAAGTYTLSLNVTGDNIANPGGTFTQIGLQAVISSTRTISGVSCLPCTASAGGGQGTSVGALTGQYTGGQGPPGEVITITDSLSGRFQVVGNNLQFGASPPLAGVYSPTVTVTNSNPTVTNSPQTYPISVTVNSVATTLTTPVTCTAIATGCAGTSGDTVGKSIGTLVPTVLNP